MRPFDEIISDLRSFAPTDGSWLRLDQILEEIWDSGRQEEAIGDLFAILERYPEDDGAGVFWSIVHGLETLPGYEASLIQSIQRTPTEFGLIMIHRIMKTGETSFQGIPYIDLLREAANHTQTIERVRDLLRNWIRDSGS